MARYRAFLPGQRDKSAETGQKMAQYIEEWEKMWDEMAGGQTNGDDKFFRCWERQCALFYGNTRAGHPKL